MAPVEGPPSLACRDHPEARLAELAGAIPPAVADNRPEVLDSPTALLTVTQAKGCSPAG